MNEKLVFAAAVCYVAPAAIELEACSEGVLCASGEYHLGGGGSYGEEDINDNGSY